VVHASMELIVFTNRIVSLFVSFFKQRRITTMVALQDRTFQGSKSVRAVHGEVGSDRVYNTSLGSLASRAGYATQPKMLIGC
jgi:hypothetical protein